VKSLNTITRAIKEDSEVIRDIKRNLINYYIILDDREDPRLETTLNDLTVISHKLSLLVSKLELLPDRLDYIEGRRLDGVNVDFTD